MTKGQVMSINNISIDTLAGCSTLSRLTFVIAFSGVVFNMGYQFIIRPTHEHYKMIKSQEIELKKNFESAQLQASGLDEYRTQLKILNKRYRELLKQLPIKNEMPELLDDVSTAATDTGVMLDSLSPEQERQHQDYIELPIKFIVSGTYHQLAAFLSKLSVMSRIITVHNFVVEKANSDEVGSADENILSLTISVAIYQYNRS